MVHVAGMASGSPSAGLAQQKGRPTMTGAVGRSPGLSSNSVKSPGLGGVNIKSPGTGLRLGLSRNSRFKPLHPNVKMNT